MNKSYDIFLCYPRMDKDASNRIVSILRGNGFSVWRDVDELIGGSFVDEIRCSIKQSKLIIAIDSKWFRESEWIKKELECAQNDGIPIFHVLTDHPNGLSGYRRMLFGSILEMSDSRCEEKLLSKIISYGIHPNTTELYKEYKDQYELALKENDINGEFFSFLKLLRITELGNEEAKLQIETGVWNIDLLKAVSSYKSINNHSIEDIRCELFNRGEIMAEDETLTDNAFRGRGMEKGAFKMMKRALDLGYEGENPIYYDWYFLSETDFEECLDMLGKSSRIHLNEQYRVSKNSSIEKGSIFISYKRIDKDKVFTIKDEIELVTGKESCWIDLDGIESDAQFVNVIVEAINRAQVFLFMYSRHHAEIKDYDNDWTTREINYAQKRKKRIVFINIDGSQLTDWFELMFGMKQQIDANSDVAMKKLCKDLVKWLDSQ